MRNHSLLLGYRPHDSRLRLLRPIPDYGPLQYETKHVLRFDFVVLRIEFAIEFG